MSANRAMIKNEFSQWLISTKSEGDDIDDLISTKDAVREKPTITESYSVYISSKLGKP